MFCWIPGAIVGLRSKQPDARVPGIINAVMSVIGIIAIIIVVVVVVRAYNTVSDICDNYNYPYNC